MTFYQKHKPVKLSLNQQIALKSALISPFFILIPIFSAYYLSGVSSLKDPVKIYSLTIPGPYFGGVAVVLVLLYSLYIWRFSYPQIKNKINRQNYLQTYGEPGMAIVVEKKTKMGGITAIKINLKEQLLEIDDEDLLRLLRAKNEGDSIPVVFNPEDSTDFETAPNKG